MNKSEKFSSINAHIWSIDPRHLEVFVDRIIVISLLNQEIVQRRVKDFEAEYGFNEQFDGYGYKVKDGTATINMVGVIEKSFDLISHIFYGTVSSEMIQKDFEKALDDPEVKQILFNIDSPGGMVSGTKEFSDWLFSQRGRKPVTAYGNSQMLSAAYYIGSAADKVYTSNSAYVGSIGVFRPHISIQDALKERGIKVTLIHAGKEKVIGNPYTDLNEDDKKIIQSEVDKQYSLFVDTVARNRSVTSEIVKTKMAEGKTFLGVDALDMGLVDGLGIMKEVSEYINQPAKTLIFKQKE